MKTGKLVLGVLILILGTGCTCFTVKPDLPCPSRPMLEAFTLEDLESMTDEAQRKAAQNQIKLKTYAKKLEARAACGE